jgi:hypothetical protein
MKPKLSKKFAFSLDKDQKNLSIQMQSPINQHLPSLKITNKAPKNKLFRINKIKIVSLYHL